MLSAFIKAITKFNEEVFHAQLLAQDLTGFYFVLVERKRNEFPSSGHSVGHTGQDGLVDGGPIGIDPIGLEGLGRSIDAEDHAITCVQLLAKIGPPFHGSMTAVGNDGNAGSFVFEASYQISQLGMINGISVVAA
jgi:hypothetical protein